jgi:integrase/recombinase XerD
MSDELNTGDLEALKGAFLKHLLLRNLTPLTIRQVDQYLRIFLGYVKGRGVTDLRQIDAELFEKYKAYLSTEYVTRKGAPLHQNTVLSRLGWVQHWFAWLRKRGALFFDPIAGVKVPRTLKRLPKGVLRPEEVQKVMEGPDLRNPIGYRDRTMMEVLYATGARASELLSLRLPDIDFEKKVIRIRHGKGGKDRFAPLSTPCCRFLRRYIDAIRPELVEGMRPAGNNWLKKAGTAEDLVFVSVYGGPFTKNWLADIMKRYITKAGITRPMQPVHGFRHSVATHLIEDGMDIRYVQVLLGHSAITSTQVYTHVERATLHRMLKDFHPLEQGDKAVLPFKPKKEKKEAHAAAA